MKRARNEIDQDYARLKGFMIRTQGLHAASTLPVVDDLASRWYVKEHGGGEGRARDIVLRPDGSGIWRLWHRDSPVPVDNSPAISTSDLNRMGEALARRDYAEQVNAERTRRMERAEVRANRHVMVLNAIRALTPNIPGSRPERAVPRVKIPERPELPDPESPAAGFDGTLAEILRIADSKDRAKAQRSLDEPPVLRGRFQ